TWPRWPADGARRAPTVNERCESSRATTASRVSSGSSRSHQRWRVSAVSRASSIWPSRIDRAPSLQGRRRGCSPVAHPLRRLSAPVLGHDLGPAVWSPGEGRLPLLVAHDGPEYDELSDLTRYAGAMIERGTLPPFRIALLPPGERDEWYSASAVYTRALVDR